MNKTILLIFVIIIAYYFLDYSNSDSFSALGALTQLYAKGPSDLYLTSDTEKYVYPPYFGNSPWWGYPYMYPVWNVPTRLNNYSGFYPYY